LAGLKFRLTNAGLDSLDLLVQHRLNMWREIHPELGAKVEESEDRTRNWIREKLSKGELIGFIAKTEDSRVAGSGCIWIREEQPRPTNPRQAQPYLMSMYTEREFRRKGVAKLIVKRALDWCRERDYERIILHASEQGKALYESFGFGPTTEMRLKF
jgi:GNAT superfamily N-acetyltransferase